MAAVKAPAGVHASVRTTAHGIPHILAGDYRSLGYGVGWAQGHDVLCPLAEAFVTVNAQRSRHFGPDGSYDLTYSNGVRPNNLQSDFFYAKAIEQRTVERLLAAPDGPAQELDEMTEGFAAGYNAALDDQKAPEGIGDPACKGKPWIRKITALDVWRRIHQLQLLASSGVAIDGIVAAAPPGGSLLGASAARTRQAEALRHVGDGRFDQLLGDRGSNAIALGRAATADGRGMQLGNPHFPWKGWDRFHQMQLTIPGEIDVAGSALLGVPLALNGFTRGLAWSHTVSVARRFAVYEVQLVPGSPTSYRVDGEVKPMKRTDVSVDVLERDGSIRKRTHSFYDTEYGPVLTSISGLRIFPWTATSAYTLFDANAENLGRLSNHFLSLNRAQSVGELDAILRRFQGIPWVNTIAADSKGNAYYADIGSMPNIDVDRYGPCSTAVGQFTDQEARLAVLDGSRSDCAPGTAPGAAAPGLLPPSRQPSLRRDDYVENSNDSYWLVNARQKLEGFSRIVGTERSARLFRTRFGIKSVEDRLAGREPGGDRFTVEHLMDLVLNNRNYAGELWRDDLAAMCRSNPTLTNSSGQPVSVSEACPVLERWDLHEELDSRGALLFRRFSEHVWLDSDSGDPWGDRFNPDDPVNTPSKLNTDDQKVRRSFADAVSELRAAGIPFDAPLRDFAYVERNGERIPIHGGPGVGAFNVIVKPFDRERGYPDVEHGTSYLHAVRMTGACPDAYTVQTYSQSTDPTSPFYADQTRLYSQKRWIDFPFCDEEIARDPALKVTDFGGGYRTTASVIRALKVRRLSRGRLLVVARLRSKGELHVKVRRDKRTVRRARRRGKRVVIVFRSVPVQPLSVRVGAKAGGRAQVATRLLAAARR